MISKVPAAFRAVNERGTNLPEEDAAGARRKSLDSARRGGDDGDREHVVAGRH
jgi:hypothetical protein